MTLTEMYLASCASVIPDNGVHCVQCKRPTVHEEQARICSAPNVLVLQVSRIPRGVATDVEQAPRVQGKKNFVGAGQLVREPVGVEERLTLPGLDAMDLVGVVYHNGSTVHSGH